MPEISRFHGIVITMYYSDHQHFHARLGESEARIGIESREVLSGRLPPRALRLVLEWCHLHRDELAADWSLAEQHKPLARIAPLE